MNALLTRRTEQGLTWIIFGGVFVYLLLRAWFVAPMHDELATMFHYIETGRIFEKGMIHDANNHLLNSWIGRLFYLIGAHHYFFYRLANVLAFALYFRGILVLCKPLSTAGLRLLTLLGCTTVPFVLDYFAFTRGYGLGMAFFVWMLYYARLWAAELRLKNAVLLLLFAVLTLLSNLIFTGLCCLALAWILFHFLIRRKQFTGAMTRRFILLLILAAGLMLPLLAYGFFLKHIGALYYGSLDGLWEVTGKSLSRLVFFSDHVGWGWLLGALLLLCTAMALIRMRMIGWRTFLSGNTGLLMYFLIGQLVFILLLAYVMRVNYPEDRAAMYFIPLLILNVAFVAQHWRAARWLPLAFLFFPVSLFWNANLDTSVFSPEMRMPDWLYARVRKQLQTGETLHLYPTNSLCWYYAERTQQQPVFPQTAMQPDTLSDVILTRLDVLHTFPDQKLYREIARDAVCRYVAFERLRPLHEIKRYGHLLNDYSGVGEHLDLGTFVTDSVDIGRSLKIRITGQVKQAFPEQDLVLHVESRAQDGRTLRDNAYVLRWNRKPGSTDFEVDLACIFEQITPAEWDLHLYLQNNQQAEFTFHSGEFTAFILKN